MEVFSGVGSHDRLGLKVDSSISRMLEVIITSYKSADRQRNRRRVRPMKSGNNLPRENMCKSREN